MIEIFERERERERERVARNEMPQQQRGTTTKNKYRYGSRIKESFTLHLLASSSYFYVNFLEELDGGMIEPCTKTDDQFLKSISVSGLSQMSRSDCVVYVVQCSTLQYFVV